MISLHDVGPDGVVVVHGGRQCQHDGVVRDQAVAKDVFAPDDEGVGVVPVLVDQALLVTWSVVPQNIGCKIPLLKSSNGFLAVC